MMNISRNIFFLFGAFLFWSCGSDDEVVDPTTELEIPSTYNFNNVSYSGQTQRLNMFSEIKNYMATSSTMGVSLDTERLAAMYANDATNANWAGIYEESKQLRGKTLENVRADFDALLVELAETSQSTVAGQEGVNGVITSLDGTKNYLIGSDGLDHAQLFEKSLMGACLYYQATSVYFGDGKMDVDNTTIIEGEGTAMEHHWDEAFGYLGVPTDFPTNTDGLTFWGDYSNNRSSVLEINQPIMAALLKGRAAISGNFIDLRDEAIIEAREQWELIAVTSALHYLNSGIANINDMALFGHGTSEALGFIYSLQFNEGKKITNAQVSELLVTIAGASNFANMNLYQTTIDDLVEARNQLAAYYNLEESKELF